MYLPMSYEVLGPWNRVCCSDWPFYSLLLLGNRMWPTQMTQMTIMGDLIAVSLFFFIQQLLRSWLSPYNTSFFPAAKDFMINGGEYYNVSGNMFITRTYQTGK